MATPKTAFSPASALILKKGAGRTRGRSAQRNNIKAAEVVGDVLKGTLGPRGMDKMLVSGLGEITITNDGATVLKQIDVQHPAARMMVEASKTQDEEVGDGTTTVVVLASELLKKAEALLEQKIHPSIITNGYAKAAEEVLAVMNNVAVTVDVSDHAILKKAITTCVRGKVAAVARDRLAEVAIDAVRHIAERKGDAWSVDTGHVQISKATGKSLGETKLIKGLIIDKEVTHPAMPKRVEKPSILLLDRPLEIEKAEMNVEIRIQDPTQMKAFLDEESKMLKSMVDKIKAAGVNLVICQRGIDDIVQHFLAREGIMAARRVKRSDVERLARACGGRVVTNIDSLQPSDLGHAKLAEERKIGDDRWIFIEGCANPKSVAVLIRGGLQRFVDEAERAFHDALHVLADIYECNKIVAGGGALEAELAKHLRRYAAKVLGKEQLAIESFANSLEVIPRTLAENAGLDPLDVLVALRASHERSNGVWNGIDVFTGKVKDMMKAGVIEPLRVKEQAIKSAVEVASMILRIDDSIIAAKSEQPTK